VNKEVECVIDNLLEDVAAGSKSSSLIPLAMIQIRTITDAAWG